MEEKLHVLEEITQVTLTKLGDSFNMGYERKWGLRANIQVFCCSTGQQVAAFTDTGNAREGTGYRRTGER